MHMHNFNLPLYCHCRATAAFSPFSFWLAHFISASQSQSFPSLSSALFLILFSSCSSLLFSHSTPLLLIPHPPVILHSSISLYPSLGWNPSQTLISHPRLSPIMTALTFSLRCLSWLDRKLNSINTLSTHKQLFPMYCPCFCWWTDEMHVYCRYIAHLPIQTRHRMTTNKHRKLWFYLVGYDCLDETHFHFKCHEKRLKSDFNGTDYKSN